MSSSRPTRPDVLVPHPHPGDDAEWPQPTREEEMAFERKRDAALQQMALRWQRPKPVQRTPEEFERMRQERLKEIEEYFARKRDATAPVPPATPRGGTAAPGSAPVAPATAPTGTPVVQGDATAPVPPAASLVARAASPRESSPERSSGAQATPNPAPAGRLPALQASPSTPAKTPVQVIVPSESTHYSAYQERERPTRRWPEQAREKKPPKRPWPAPSKKESKQHFPVPYALWPAEPVYLPVPEAAPPPERPLKRKAPTLDSVAPLPHIERSATDGAWMQRFAALDTTTDLWYVLLVGINAVIELRKEHWAWMDWEDALPLRAGHGLLQRPVPGLWDSPLLPWQAEGTLAVLQTEVEQIVRVLEVLRVREPAQLEQQVEEMRQEALRLRLARLEQVVKRLRREMHKRRAVRRVAELLAQFAWRSLESLFLPEMPSRRQPSPRFTGCDALHKKSGHIFASAAIRKAK